MANKDKDQIRRAPGPDVDLETEDVRDMHGNRIDEAYVARMVEHVHSTPPAVMGRPSLTGPGQRSPQVAVRLPEALRAAAETHARREGKSVSAIMRDALERYLEEVES